MRILHGGDFLYPSLESQLWDGLQMVDAMNFLNALHPCMRHRAITSSIGVGPSSLIAALQCVATSTGWVTTYVFNTGTRLPMPRCKSAFTFEAR